MTKRRTISLWLSCGSAVVLCVFGPAVAAELPTAQRQEHGGVAVEFRFEPHENQASSTENPARSLPGVTRLSFTDTASGRAYGGIRPAAWIMARRSQQVANELSCEDKARQFTAGSLGSRADIDLNAYRLVTLNQDNTVAFINPFVSLQNSKLESIVQLPGRGYDWVLVPDHHRLVISLRDRDTVVVLDTHTRKVVKEISFPAGSQPTRVALDPDGRRVWVGLDGHNEVAILDAAAMVEHTRVPVGRGLHTLAVAADRDWIFVTNSEDDSVSIIDRRREAKTTDVPVGKTPVAIAWSAAAQRLAVATLNGGTLDLVDPLQASMAARVPLAPGVVELGVFDQGRYALAVNQLQGRVTLIDLAMSAIKGSIDVASKPDRITFSRQFAYVRGQGTANISVINLHEARSGRLQSVSVQMGERAPQDAPESINVASVMAPSPEGDGVVVANAPDRIIYRYAEGMMAPVGNFSNYKRLARALLVLDSSLSEREPGRFVAPTTFDFGGQFDVIVKSLRPAVTACFTVTVDGLPRQTSITNIAHTISAKLGSVSRLLNGPESAINLLLTDPQHRPVLGVRDGVLLAVQQHGTWQRRVPIRELGEGRYEAHLSFPEPADFELLLTIPSHELGYTQGKLGRISLPVPTHPTTTAEGQTGAQHVVR
ncbi:MAG: hypothetical protein CAF41_012735 [Nitrospira sp. CG24A]|nr:MAG: hypothetical protein CAF41_012735 [Nitrospira sp. CG24A]